MCKGFDSLSGIVILELKVNVLIRAVFMFINKKHNQVKLFLWKGDDFAMQATLVMF
jgi:transposase